MHVKSDNQSPTKLTLTITADDKDLKVIKDEALQALAKDVKVSGFRSGKAPLSVIEKNIDDQTLQSKVVDEAINRLYIKAAQKSDIRPVGQPQVTLKKFVPYTELEFDVETEVIGDVKLPNYKTIKKTQEKVSVSADEVKKVIDDLLTKSSKKEDVSRGAKQGDEVTIDFLGKDEKGKEIKGAEGKDYPLMLGSNTFIPGFEDNLIGLKSGESKTFKLTFPKDYGVKALANKKVEFSVEVKGVKELTKPKLDDEFVKTIGSFSDVASLKKDIKTQLLQEKQSQANNAFENQIVNEIVDKTKVELPKLLVDEQVERLKTEIKQNLMYRGQTWQEMLEFEGLSEEDYIKQKLIPEAQQRVKTGLVLSEIADQEKIVVTPEELETRMQLLKGQYTDPSMQAELSKPEARQEIGSRLMTEKTLNRLVELVTKR